MLRKSKRIPGKKVNSELCHIPREQREEGKEWALNSS